MVFVCDKGFLKQSTGIMQNLPFAVDIKTIPSGKLRRYAHFSWWHYLRHFSIVLHNLTDLVKTFFGFIKSIFILIKFRPDVVFAKGGFVCLPVGYAAKLLGIPIVIHDSDARPGLTNKLMSRFAKAIGTGMPLENYTYNPNISRHVGVPIDPAIVPATVDLKRQYRQEFDLPDDKNIIVAVGGGLGSKIINQAMIGSARYFVDQPDVYFVNVTGVGNYDEVKEQAVGLANYRPLAFVYKDLYRLLGAADLVVTRASATTLQELAGLRQAVIAVPAKQLGDQRKNAELFASYDAVVDISDDDLPDELPGAIKSLIDDPKRRTQLAANIYSYAKPQAAKDMAEIILGVART